MAPVMINAHFHPQATAMKGTVSGATMAPMLVPELKIPVAKDLSFLGKYDLTRLF